MDILISLAIHISYLFSLITIIINKNLPVIWEPIGFLYVFDSIGIEIKNYIGLKNDQDKVKLEALKEVYVLNKENKKVLISTIKKGDIVIFKKGDIVQLDGTLVQEEGILDTSNINGESTPYYAKESSLIISGSKVINEKIYIKITQLFKDSTLNKLILLINKTDNVKPNIQKIADKIAKILIPFVLVFSIFVWISWMFIGYFANITPISSNQSGSYVYNSFFIAISVLAITCPCAMSMTSPLINLVSAQSYWKSNIIFNKTEDMEKILFINEVVLDKTGTLTTNKMNIINTFGEDKYHSISAGLEKSVFHPIANALYKKFNKNLKINNIENKSGHGVSGVFQKNNYFIGHIKQEDIEKTFNVKVINNGTFVGLFKEKKLVSAYILESKIKKDAYKLIKFFKEKNIHPIILSGDNEKATKEIANKLNIEYRSNQKPEDKSKYIQERQKENKKVMMIGDGLNDSIAIKYADVSISFASGSSISNSYSSISLLTDDLNNIIYLIKMGKIARNNYKLAIGWAVGFNILFLPFAAFGFFMPWMAAFIMYLSNLILLIIIINYKRRLNKLEENIYGSKLKTKMNKIVNKKEFSMKTSCH